MHGKKKVKRKTKPCTKYDHGKKLKNMHNNKRSWGGCVARSNIWSSLPTLTLTPPKFSVCVNVCVCMDLTLVRSETRISC